MEVPMHCKLLSYSVPLSRCSGTGDDFMVEFLNDGLADLGNEVADGVFTNQESICEGLVGITSCQVPQGDGQLEAYRHGSTVVGVLLFNRGPSNVMSSWNMVGFIRMKLLKDWTSSSLSSCISLSY